MALENPDFTFQKLTIANSKEVGGSDITSYKLFQKDVLIGKIQHDNYYKKTLISLADERYRITSGFFSGTVLYNDTTNKKLARVRKSSWLSNYKATLIFNDGIRYSMSISNFAQCKSYQLRMHSAQDDILFDFLVQNPDTLSSMRDIPLEGEIAALEFAQKPLLVLYGLALLELLIVFCMENPQRH